MMKGIAGGSRWAAVMYAVLTAAALSGCGGEEKQETREETDIAVEDLAYENDGQQEMEAEVKDETEAEEKPIDEAFVPYSYEGKTLSILGDSISTFEGWIPEGYVDFFPMYGEVETVDETWWKLLMDDMGMEFCANSSSAGSTCAGDSLSETDPKSACSGYRIGELTGEGGVYPDVIIVYIGTNDLLTSVPLGENDGTQPVEEGLIENFSDAYSLMLDKLEAQYPGAEILCCTLAQVGDWGTENRLFVTFTNSLGFTAGDYSGRIEIIAGNKGMEVINLTDCGITEKNMHKYVTDGVHLNADGMKLVEETVKAALTK